MTKMEDFKDTLKRTIKQNSFAVCSIPTEDCKEILQALEKQIPTKAKLEGNLFYCPRCNFAIGDIKEKTHRFCPKYCSNCGQNTGGLKYFDDNH